MPRSIHVSDRKVSLEVGKDTDMVLVDAGINVHLTVAEGQVVYQASAQDDLGSIFIPFTAFE